MKMLISKDNRT